MHGSILRKTLISLALAAYAMAGGCAWMQRLTAIRQEVPQVLPPGAGLEQVIAAVNRNNSQIQTLSSTSASISGSGYPTLRAKIAFQRPRYFRLIAETAVTGSEVDLGSNDQIFWFWVKRNQPPALYFCRHEQFATSQARAIIPIEPNWLIEALGTVQLDPSLPHQGPYPDKNNRLQIRTIRESPDGPNMKVTVVDATSGWVVEQQIFDPRGRLRARSTAEGYRCDPQTGIYIPTAVQVECPEAKFSLRVDLGAVAVNQPQGNPAELWTLPTAVYPGSPPVDLGDPNLRFGPPSGVPSGVPARTPPVAARLRGWK